MSSTRQVRRQPSTESVSAESLRYRRIVVKAGTSILTTAPDHQGLDPAVMSDLVRQISHLHRLSVEVLLVTSGAIAAGHQILGQSLDNLGRDIPSRQVLAAVGQGQLMHTYEELFAGHEVKVAQSLLTINDLADRQSYLNVRNTLIALLELGVVPILNENDVVAVDEIGEVFGDNDRLSALVAKLVDADLLVVLTDTEGLYTADPQVDREARLIPLVEQVDADIEERAGAHHAPWARGGMLTKIEAARLGNNLGYPHGYVPRAGHRRRAAGCPRGSRWYPIPARHRKAGGPQAMDAQRHLPARRGLSLTPARPGRLQDRNSSLLPAGVKDIKGEFRRGDIIYILAEQGQQVACGIANYASADIARIRGLRSDRIQEVLGYHYGQEVVHRNNLVLL